MGITKIAANLTKVTDSKGIEIWYSYETPVAVQLPTQEAPIVSVNEWSNTTAKHLTRIDGGTPEAKSKRLPNIVFVSLLSGLGH